MCSFHLEIWKRIWKLISQQSAQLLNHTHFRELIFERHEN